MKALLPYLKAHTAAILAVAFWLVAALHDGNISGPEWLGLPAALGLGGAVAAVPNKPKASAKTKPTKPARDHGYGLIEVLIVVILILVIVGILTRWH